MYCTALTWDDLANKKLHSLLNSVISTHTHILIQSSVNITFSQYALTCLSGLDKRNSHYSPFIYKYGFYTWREMASTHSYGHILWFSYKKTICMHTCECILTRKLKLSKEKNGHQKLYGITKGKIETGRWKKMKTRE